MTTSTGAKWRRGLFILVLGFVAAGGQASQAGGGKNTNPRRATLTWGSASPDDKIIEVGVIDRRGKEQFRFLEADTGRVLAGSQPDVDSMFESWGPGESYFMVARVAAKEWQLRWARSIHSRAVALGPVSVAASKEPVQLADGVFDPRKKHIIAVAPDCEETTNGRHYVLVMPLEGGSTGREIFTSSHQIRIVGVVSDPRNSEESLVLLGEADRGRLLKPEILAITASSGSVRYRVHLGSELGVVGESQPYTPGHLVVPVTIGTSVLKDSGIHTQLWDVDVSNGDSRVIAQVPADTMSLRTIPRGSKPPLIFLTSNWDVWRTEVTESGATNSLAFEGTEILRPMGPIRVTSNGEVEAYFSDPFSVWRYHALDPWPGLFWTAQ